MVKMNFWGPPGTSYIRNLTFLLSGPDVKHICSWAVSAIVRGVVSGLVAAGLLSRVTLLPLRTTARKSYSSSHLCFSVSGTLWRPQEILAVYSIVVSPALTWGFLWSHSRGRTRMAYFLAECQDLVQVLGMPAQLGFILFWRSSFNLRKLVVSDYITFLWPLQMASNCF